MITARTATVHDWEAILRLLSAAALPTEDLSATGLEGFLVAERVRDEHPEIVGLVGLQKHADVGLLRSLVVLDVCRGEGIGASLVAELEAAARQSRVRELWLLTIDADRFFAKHGFVVAERAAAPSAIRQTQEFSELCPADATLMRKRL